MNKALKQAIAIAGGPAALGRELGITGQAVSIWDKVPIRHLIAVEKLTGVTRDKLRPDIFK